jgi:DNA helicase-2/ATP-dependent DNA helicase PcrA
MTVAIEVGDRVINARFGSGTVIAVDDNKLTIEFDSGKRRHIASAFVIRWGGIEVVLSGALAA